MSPKFLLLIFTPFLLLSCASQKGELGTAVDQRAASATASLFSQNPTVPSLAGKVTRERAVSYATTQSPRLKALRAELRALQAETIQAGLRPNPELGLELENFAGTGSPRRGFDSSQISGVVSQRLELGGKRKKRELVAALKTRSLAAAIAKTELEVALATDRAFTSLLAARQLRRVAQKNLSSSQEQVKTLLSLIEAGAASSIDGNRAKLELSGARERLADTQSIETKAASELSRLWGGGATAITALGSLKSNGLATSPLNPASVIRSHPAMKAAALGFATNQADYELQRAGRISDVDVIGGVRNFEASDETAAIVGLSIPLPLFDKNQGNIAAAKERVEKARAEGQAVQSGLRAQITQLNSDLTAAKSRVSQIDSTTIAAAEQSLQDTRTAYSAGKKSLLEFIDARKTLFDIESRGIKARADLQKAAHSLARLQDN